MNEDNEHKNHLLPMGNVSSKASTRTSLELVGRRSPFPSSDMSMNNTNFDEDFSLSHQSLMLNYNASDSEVRKDFQTIDWFHSKHKFNDIERKKKARNMNSGIRGLMEQHFRDCQGWIILLLVGIFTALTASLLHSSANWLGDFKLGFCRSPTGDSDHAIWMSKDLCCLDAVGGKGCPQWVRWNDAFSNTNSNSSGGGDSYTTIGYIFDYFMYVLISVSFAFLASWLVVVYSAKGRVVGSGIPEVKTILGGFIIRKFLGVRTLFIKSMTLVLAVASGLNLGKEGPLVHISCSWSHILSRRFDKYKLNEVKRRELLSAAAAAGVSVAFGAPLGGVLFSLESVSSYFPPKTMWRSFWCAIAATLVIRYIDPFNTGQLVQFSVTNNTGMDTWKFFELVPFAILGCLGGALGSLVIAIITKLEKWRRSNSGFGQWSRAHPVLEVGAVACVTALVNFSNIYLRGSSLSLLHKLFSSCSSYHATQAQQMDPDSLDSTVGMALCGADLQGSNTDGAGTEWLNLSLLLLAGLFKLVLCIFTFGLKIPCGIFVPALASGACLGRVFGWLLHLWHKEIGDSLFFSVCAGQTYCVSPHIYAVVASAAMLCGITRMTMSLAVVMFELTGGLDLIIPLMLAIVCAKFTGDLVCGMVGWGDQGKSGIFGKMIHLNGYPHIDQTTKLRAAGVAEEIMTPNPVYVTMYGMTLRELMSMRDRYPYHVFPLIDNERSRTASGVIARSDLEVFIEKAKYDGEEEGARVHFSTAPPPYHCPDNHLNASVYVDKFPVNVLPATPAERILDLFKGLGLRYCVVKDEGNRLVGVIKKKDVLLYCLQ